MYQHYLPLKSKFEESVTHNTYVSLGNIRIWRAFWKWILCYRHLAAFLPCKFFSFFQVLSHHLAQFLSDNTSVPVSPEVRSILRNLTGLSSSGSASGEPPPLLRVPSIYHFLPHLLESPASLRPGFVLSKGRTGGESPPPSFPMKGSIMEA